MIELSSRITPLTKFVLPGVFLASSPTWIVVEARDPRMLIGAILWVVINIFLLWWTAPIKKVAVADGQFRISNFLREVTVPTGHLVRLKEDRRNRTPNITLFFDPPTDFGSKVRVIPPMGEKEFDRVAQLLADLIQSKRTA